MGPWRGRCASSTPGAVYHVTSRGNARQAIFRDDGDRQYLLAVLAVEKTRDVKEMPRAQRLVGRPRVERLLAGSAERPRTLRNDLSRAAAAKHGYLPAEIARATGLHYSTISRIAKGR